MFDFQANFQFYNAAPLQKQRLNLREVNNESVNTTRSGTPDSKGFNSDSNDELNQQTEIVEIGVKPKKREFKTVEERQRFVENYKMKIKTELCKNFELRGWCKFGESCSFAHGKHELQEKTHLHSKYKTQPCKQFHLYGHCNYGNRCQYLHAEAIMPNIFHQASSKCINAERSSYSYSLLQDLFKMVNNTNCKVENILAKIPKRPRLPIFESITEKSN